MNKNKKEYRRLPGKKRRFVGESELLFEGPDHLLLVKSTGASEDYRRFYYKDIKYLHVTKTRITLIENLMTIGLIILSGLLGVSVWEDIEPLSVFLWMTTGAFFLYLLLNIMSGGSCECWTETDVQRERLYSVNRIRQAKKLFKRISPLIEKEQGRLTPEALVKVLLKPMRDKSGPVPKATSDAAQLENGSWHKGLYLSLTASGMLAMVSLFYHPLPIVLVESVLFAAIGILSVIVIARQAGSTLKKSLKSLTWVILGIVIIGFVIGYIEMVVIFFKNVKNPAIFQNELELFKEYARMDRLENTFMLGDSIFHIISNLACGLTGLFLIREK